jgi:prepilin-type N-terminal cleavage/methylation domain-containing protein
MSGLMRRGTERRRRRGMTLIEIMISLVLLGIVGGVIMRVIMRQQRFYQGVNQIMTQRGQLRNATSVLPVDLRSLSSVGNDIIVATDSSMEFMVNVGTGVVCSVVNNAQVAMPPTTLANGQTITTWYGYDEPNPTLDPVAYTVYIYNDSVTLGNEDDEWKKFTLAGLHHDASQCLTTFATNTDAGKQRPVLELTDPAGFTDPVTSGPLSQYIGVGAPVRVLKRVRYALYQAGDGKWYLGFSPFLKATSAYDTPSPVSGPYDPYVSGSGAASGFGFRYYDVDGNEIASGADATQRARIARVDLIARARTASNVRTAGVQNGATQQYKDSLAVSVMLRNRQ